MFFFLSGILQVGIWVAILVEFFRRKKRGTLGLKYGTFVAGIFLISELVMLGVRPDLATERSLGLIALVDLVVALRWLVMAHVGISCLQSIGWRATAFAPGEGRVWDRLRPGLLAGVGVALLCAGWSWLVFRMLRPENGVLVELIQQTDVAGWRESMGNVIGLSQFAVGEELVYRLGIFGWLMVVMRKDARGFWIVTILTTLLWTVQHYGMLSPNWIKYVQIAPLGVGCALLMRRYGIEAAIMAHLAFNWLLYPFSEWMLRPGSP